MKKPFKPRTSRPAPAEIVRVAARAAPSLPPAQIAEDKLIAFGTRLRISTVNALEAKAREEGTSIKLVLCKALKRAGIQVAPADLEDRTPVRSRKWR
jgi:hypothetical protein